MGHYKPNAHGLYDMGGDAWEWLNTWYTKDLNDDATYKEYSWAENDGGGGAGGGEICEVRCAGRELGRRQAGGAADGGA